MNISIEFRRKVSEAIQQKRQRFSGSDSAFAKQLDIHPSIYNRIKKGETEGVLSDAKWLKIGRELDVNIRNDNWKIARTEVYEQIESNIHFCKEYSKAMILVDSWGIGKTEAAKHISKTLPDTFYLDCSQSKTKIQFTRDLAKTIGLDNKGRYLDVKANVKFYLSNILVKPIVILDDTGDLEYPAFLDLKEYWNGTENRCAWYMIGDDSLRAKMNKGIEKQKVGYGAIFSRFSDEFISLVPVDKKRKQDFMIKLVGDVAKVNTKAANQIPKLVKQCVSKEKTLRHLKTLIQLQA